MILFLQGPPPWAGFGFSGGVRGFSLVFLFHSQSFPGGPSDWLATSHGFGHAQRAGSFFVTVKPTEMAEPSSYLLLMVGLGALAGFSLRRRSQQA